MNTYILKYIGDKSAYIPGLPQPTEPFAVNLSEQAYQHALESGLYEVGELLPELEQTLPDVVSNQEPLYSVPVQPIIEHEPESLFSDNNEQ